MDDIPPAWPSYLVPAKAGKRDNLSKANGKSVRARREGAGTQTVLSCQAPTIMAAWRPLGDSNPCYRRERAVS